MPNDETFRQALREAQGRGDFAEIARLHHKPIARLEMCAASVLCTRGWAIWLCSVSSPTSPRATFGGRSLPMRKWGTRKDWSESMSDWGTWQQCNSVSPMLARITTAPWRCCKTTFPIRIPQCSRCGSIATTCHQRKRTHDWNDVLIARTCCPHQPRRRIPLHPTDQPLPR